MHAIARHRRHSWASLTVLNPNEDCARVELSDVIPKLEDISLNCMPNMRRRARRNSTCEYKISCSNSPSRSRRNSMNLPISCHFKPAIDDESKQNGSTAAASEWLDSMQNVFKVDSSSRREFLEVVSKDGEHFRHYVLCDARNKS